MVFDDARARWNARYAGDDLTFGSEPNDTLAAHAARFAPGDRVLCVADGEGRNSTWLAARGCVVTAFDLSDVGVAKARALAARRGVTVDCREASIDDWRWAPAPGEAPCDAVVAVFVQFADPARRAAMFAGFAQALRPGGLLLLVGYGPLQMTYRTGGPGILENLYTEALLRESFASWRIERLAREQRELHEGSGHDGLSDVIELLAIRS